MQRNQCCSSLYTKYNSQKICIKRHKILILISIYHKQSSVQVKLKALNSKSRLSISTYRTLDKKTWS